MPDHWSPDPRLSRVPADTLRRHLDRPLRRTFPRLERLLVRLSDWWNPGGRPLHGWERQLVREFFGDSVEIEPIRVVETVVLNAPTVLGNRIRVPRRYSFEQHPTVLVHEIVHIWQYQNGGTSYITDSAWYNARAFLTTGERGVAYLNYRLTPDSRFGDFTAEQQASIVGDCYELTRVYHDAATVPAWVLQRRIDLPIYHRLVEEMRGTRPSKDLHS